jgi:hypothetical protein
LVFLVFFVGVGLRGALLVRGLFFGPSVAICTNLLPIEF